MVLTVAGNYPGVEITKVLNGETALVKNTAYTLDDLEVTLKKEYLDDLAADDYVITIETNCGDIIVPITVGTYTVISLDVTATEFDINEAGENYKDITTTVVSDNATTSVTKVKLGAVDLTEGASADYVLTGLVVKFRKEYLITLDEKANVFTIVTNHGELEVTITVEDTTDEG